MAFLNCVVWTRPRSGLPQRHGRRVVGTCEDPSESGQDCVFNRVERFLTVSMDPEARAWRGDPHNVRVGGGSPFWAGTPVGTRAFVLNEWSPRQANVPLLRNPCHSGFTVCVAPPVVLRRCASQLLLKSHSFATLHDNQIWECFCCLVGVDSTTVQWSSRETALRQAHWAQCGQLEARSTLGQLGRQHENDHGTPPGSCSDHFACDQQWKRS